MPSLSSYRTAPEPPPGAVLHFENIRAVPSQPEPVTSERVGPAAVLTMDRQERRNAVDGPTAELLAAGYERFESDAGARVLILTGAGDVAFCAGADLKAIETFAPRLEEPRGPLGFTRLTPSQSTLAAVSRWCLGGRLRPALLC